MSDFRIVPVSHSGPLLPTATAERLDDPKRALDAARQPLESGSRTLRKTRANRGATPVALRRQIGFNARAEKRNSHAERQASPEAKPCRAEKTPARQSQTSCQG